VRGLISIYLDVFRFLAAMGVFFSHAEQYQVSFGVLPHIYFAQKLVIIFFVISGFVIAASASRPDRTLAYYSADRVARLASVVIPALALTYCLDAIGSRASPEIYSMIDPHWQSVRLLVNLLYCQQIWSLCVIPSSNTPFWSLGYEFWYYVLFGVWIFVKSKKAKVLLLLAISLFIGPKILLLLPAWAMGAIAFQASTVYKCSFRTSLVLFVATGLGTVMAIIFEKQLCLSNVKAGIPPLYYSSNFSGDNVFAIIVAASFFCCALFSRHLMENLEFLRVVKLIRWLASHTFSLYLYHLPILLFIRAVTKYDPYNPVAVLIAICISLLIVVGLSKITEEQYPTLRSLSRRWLNVLAVRMRPLAIRWKCFLSQSA
jgi:peptidoglycan/LPS O-acetylase OafA/YrhL